MKGGVVVAKELIGVEIVSYQSKKNNQMVNGVRIHVLEDLSPPNIGKRTISEYVSEGRIEDFPLGPILTILYEPTFGNKHRCVGVIPDYDN